MPSLERGGYGVTAPTIRQVLTRLGVGGVILPGSVGYDTYPTAAASVGVVSGGSSNTLGSDGALIAGSTITNPFYLCNLAVASFKAATSNGVFRWQAKVATVVQRTCPAMFNWGSGALDQRAALNFSPFLCPANAAIASAVASTLTTQTTNVYATVLKKSPIPFTGVANTSYLSVGTLLPNDVTGISLTSSGSGTFAAWGSYVSMIASTSTPIIITKVYLKDSGGSGDHQVSIATGATSSEVDLGIWGIAATPATATGNIVEHRLPYPILIDQGVQLSARNRTAAASRTCVAWIEYYPLPVLNGIL